MFKMQCLLLSLLTICSIARTSWSLPEPRLRHRQNAQPGATATKPQTVVTVTTTVSSSPYTLTYVSPTGSHTSPVSASTTADWVLIPPLIPLPFAPAPVIPPPEAPELPTIPEDPQPSISIPAPGCTTSIATFGVASCTEVVWVSSHTIQSSLTGCSTSSSTLSGCSLTASTGVSTSTIVLGRSSVSPTTEMPISYTSGPLPLDVNPPDDPNLVFDLFKDQLNISPPVEPPRGALTCAPKVDKAPIFHWRTANGNVMNFCGHGIDITDDGISRNYTSPDGVFGVTITSTYAVNESCPAGGKTTWDEARCKFLLNRPLADCVPVESGLSDSIDLYGGTILADCVKTTIKPFSTQEVICGAFDNGGGMGFKAFTPETANDAIDKYCNSDTYTADASRKDAPYGVPINGYARDRFWYKGGTYCLTTSPRPPVPNIPKDQSACDRDGSMDYEIDVGVQFDANQTGCENEQSYAVPRGLACTRMLQKVVSGCRLDGPDFGGRVEVDSPSGCLQWWLYASASQIG
ncbi:hypothetical protein G7Y79_00025g057700 [Physcia stellaris]|nr:hypothetical protein G7Y79_00025g057700 [Physcia stellaris]